MYVKICGLRTAAAAERAALAGADAVGVVMSEKSPRHASEDEARTVLAAARAISGEIDTVLVVRELSGAEAARLAARLGFDVVQLHGAHTRADFAAARAILPRVWRATSLAKHPDLVAGEFEEERLLVDGIAAGSGEGWDLSQVTGAELGRTWLLAGGLTPQNVAAAIAAARPGGVDVSSGVERAPGVKDLELIDAFVAASRRSAA